MALLHATQLYLGNTTVVYPTLFSAYTVPAGNRIILRSVAVRNLSGTATINFFVHISGTRVWSTTLSPSESDEWRPWVVMTPAEVLQFALSATGSGVGTVASGSIYTI